MLVRPSLAVAGISVACVVAFACSRSGLDLPILELELGPDAGVVLEDAGATTVFDAGSDATLERDTGTSEDATVEAPDSSDAGTDASVPAFELCAQGEFTGDNAAFLNTAGIDQGATFALTQSGDTLTAKYVNGDGIAQSFTFNATTSTSATLVPMPGQPLPGFTGVCVQGPGDDSTYPATFTESAGTLTYDEGAVYLAIDGTLEGDGGACGPESTPATYWVLCGDVPPFEVEDAGVPSAPQLPVGPFVCNSGIGEETVNQFAGGGGPGALEVTQVGSEVTATYAGDSFLAGTLSFTSTTATTANGAPGNSLMAPCLVPGGMGGGSGGLTPFTLSTSSIAIAGSTLFVSFAGTMGADSSCEGAVVAGSIVCTPAPMK